MPNPENNHDHYSEEAKDGVAWGGVGTAPPDGAIGEDLSLLLQPLPDFDDLLRWCDEQIEGDLIGDSDGDPLACAQRQAGASASVVPRGCLY